MVLHLPDVALVVVDTVCPELAALAILESCSKVKFGSIHVWSNKLDSFWGCFPNQTEVHLWKCRATCFNDVAEVTWSTVAKVVDKKFVLIQHWDSWVLDTYAWDDNFLAHDYIGAPWGWHRDGNQVGNGGFCLRSMRLVKRVAADKLWFHWGQPEDVAVCRINYDRLKTDFSFAPMRLAAQFAFERGQYADQHRHFGFHGVFNFRAVMSSVEFERRMKLVQANEYLKNKKEVLEAVNEQRNGLG